MKNEKVENVIVIGGGPAGLSAAIYLARSGLSPLVVAGSPPGGQLMLTSEVENYPGFESILGSELIARMRKHADKFNTRFIDENIINIDFKKAPFILSTPSQTLKAKTVLIATGARAMWLGLESEKKLRGKGVSACATCDGFFFRNKNVAVIGGGDTALEEALTLTKFASFVYIIHRRDSFRASKVMVDRVLANKKIKIIWNAQVEEIVGTNKVEGVRLKMTDDGLKMIDDGLKMIDDRSLMIDKAKKINYPKSMIYDLKLDGIFVAIGHKPDTEIFKNKIKLDEKGYIVTFKSSQTSVPGIFAAGDCVDSVYRQAIVATGMGAAAALDVERSEKF